MSGAETPNYVQVPPNSTGLKVATSELTDANLNVVERQQVVIADPSNTSLLANVFPEGLAVTTVPDPKNGATLIDYLRAILVELRISNYLFAEEHRQQLVAESLRDDPSMYMI